MFCLAYNLNDGLFLNYKGDGNIHATQTKEEILKDVVHSYNKSHARNYEGSMSACIHFISTHPIVVEVPDTGDQIMDILVRSESGGVEVFSLSSMASRGTKGLKVKPELAEEMIKSGTVPELMNEDFNNIKNKEAL